jgi:hypothetical protein
MTAAQIYLTEADEWNERSKSASDPELRAAYTILAVTYRKIGTRLGELRSAGGDDKLRRP